MNNNICKSALRLGGSIYPLVIPNDLTNGTGLTNPSILKVNGKLMLNIRHVQYSLYHSEKNQKHQSPYGSLVYLNPEDDNSLRTVNFLCELDEQTFEIKSINKVDMSKLDTKPLWDFIGLEDARLVNWDDNFYLSGVRRDTTTNGVGRMELSKIKNNKEVSRLRIEPPTDAYCEKNWMPILDMPYHYVKWCSPTEIVKVNPLTKKSETVHLINQKVNFKRDLRGGSQVVRYKNYWVALTHEVDLWNDEQGRKDAEYYHRFIVWDNDWNIVYHSEDFKFMDARIEFSCGLHFGLENILIPFGFQDTTAFLLEMPIRQFERMVGITNEAQPQIYNQLHPSLFNKIIEAYISNPNHAQSNYILALNYFNQAQYSSALSFFLRTAELEGGDNMTYESLLFVALCLKKLGRLETTELSLWNNALRFAPNRPEAYLFLSQYYEERKKFSEAQSFARIGLEFKHNQIELNPILGYYHYYQLMFQDALCDWNLGQGTESRKKFKELAMGNHPLNKQYSDLIQINMTSLGCSGNPFLPYNNSMSEKLRYKFYGYDKIDNNFSQTFQDMFTLCMLDGLTNGTYLEIGAADPFKGSNSALLEKLGWSGISLEILEKEVTKFRSVRKNPVVLCDALEYDYSKLGSVIDYLQVDCEPPAITYEILTKLPFATTDFKVITYEHDYYTDMTGSYRELSRNFLSSKGYTMVVGNIAPDETIAYEDWWVKPEYIDPYILSIMIDPSDKVKNAKTYMLSESKNAIKPMQPLPVMDFSNARFVTNK